MSRNAELEREIAELKRRIYEIERRSANEHTEEPLPEGGEIAAVVCRVDETRLALLLEDVERVFPLVHLEPLPESPPWIHGILRIGGRAVPVIDVASRMSRRPREAALEEHIVLCRDGRNRVGLVVREVLGVSSFRLAREGDALVATNVSRGPYVRATLSDAEGLVLLFSLRRLISTSDIPALEEPEMPARRGAPSV